MNVLKRKLPDDSGATSHVVEPFTVPCNRKNAAAGIWLQDEQLVEITKMKGGFWRTHGFSNHGRNFLYPEEALLLVEKGHIYIETSDGHVQPSSEFYEMITSLISVPVYLAYCKLKLMDYVVQRYDNDVSLINGYEGYTEIMNTSSKRSILSRAVSFQLYRNENWSKKNATSDKILGHVIVVTGDSMPPVSCFLELLELSAGVPLVFAAVTTSGHVFLNEFSDALSSLSWLPGLAATSSPLLELSGEDELL